MKNNILRGNADLASNNQHNVSSAIPWHQLIIIGNGFDIQCNLPSRFSDFYENRRVLLFPDNDILESAGLCWGIYLRENGLTVWDLILEKNSNSAWCDIEAEIAKWVLPVNRRDMGLEKSHALTRTLSLLCPSTVTSDIPDDERHSQQWRIYQGKKIADRPEKNIARYIVDSSGSTGWTRSKLLAFLYAELKVLEEKFADYLLEITGKAYDERAYKLLRAIATQEILSSGHHKLCTSLLDFNFTEPPCLAVDGTYESTNIHGRFADGEIVFGIDGKEYMDYRDVIPFTKTYRLLGFERMERRPLFRPIGTGLDDNSTRIIKVYGHSLSNADYSYFQSIFDGVDIYRSHTRLVFYYKPGGNDDDREKLYRRVTELLTTYGKTMDNIDHGKNLMHKLILEGRLSVRELSLQ